MHTCAFCNGSGFIQWIDSGPYPCRECMGSGRVALVMDPRREETKRLRAECARYAELVSKIRAHVGSKEPVLESIAAIAGLLERHDAA